MKKDKKSASHPNKQKTYLVVLICVAVVLALILVGMIAYMVQRTEKSVQENTVQTSEMSLTEDAPIEKAEPTDVQASAVEESIVEETALVENESGMLPLMEQLYTENQDIVGWLRVGDTDLNCPVMYTPDEPEKYLRKDFEGDYSIGGEPFIDEDCSLDPESDNLIIYGHNMSNGSQFGSLLEFEDQAYYEEHPYITFYTLYEERTYEIIACFYDRVYYKSENVFKFYQFIDADSEDEFNEAMENFKAKSEYDTGVTGEFGDNLIMLVTCSGEDYTGRFVVVAKEITDTVMEYDSAE